MTSKKNIESMYGLSPMQQGMLFHALYAPGSDMYVEQVSSRIEGALDLVAFRHAWQQVVARHAPLRTSFHWTSQAQPLQVVHQRVALPWAEEDWRGLSAAAQQTRLDSFLEADRARGFDLDKPPLLRFSLIRLADAAYHFIWTHHHLLLDGWSIPLVLQEVVAFYEAQQQHQTPALALSRPYRDYIAWLQQQDMAKAEAFWRQTLAGFTSPTPLPGDRQSELGTAQPAEYATGAIDLPAEMADALQQFVRQHQLTLSTLIQATWALLLARYSGEREVVFGTTVSGRPSDLPGVETMVGLFINTLPVRVRIALEAPVAAWLQRVQAQLVELRQYEYTPLVQIQSWSAVPHGQPLFESIVVFENYPVNSAAEAGLRGVTFRQVPSTEQTNYPLTLVAMPGHTLRLHLLYALDRCSPALIARLLGHIHTLLAAIRAEPTASLAALPLLTRAERQQLLVDWNQTHTAYPHDRSIPQLFDAQVARSPDAIALVAHDDQLSYRALQRRANRLAHLLRRADIGPEVPVALLLDRSPALVIATLAVLKVGGVYVPLDPLFPPERLAFMLTDARASVLLVATKDEGRRTEDGGRVQPVVVRLSSFVGQVIDLDALAPALARECACAPPLTTTPDNLAYVMYTSGSTGTPKGIAIPQRGVVRLVQGSSFVALNAATIMLQLAPSAFDAATFELWGSLLNGGRLVLAPPGTPSVAELGQLLDRERINVLWLTAGLFHALVAEPAARLGQVAQVLAGGDVLSPAAVAQLRAANDGGWLVNGYGPTENTTFTCCHVMVRSGAALERPVPIGRPIANTQVYVLDTQMQPVPIGVVGELYAGGDGLARGYLGRPDLTAERFVPNPFAEMSGMGYRVLGTEPSDIRYPTPDTRLYKTGDLVRYQRDGALEFVGRADAQVKLRGYRIELGEIETLLAQHAAVREAVVLAREDAPGELRLVAYVVPGVRGQGPGSEDKETRKQGDKETEALVELLTPDSRSLIPELRDYLKQRLPDYMLPSAFVELEALPLTPNGKLDRRALPEPERAGPERDAAFVPPATPMQAVLAGIWEHVLGLEQVGLHDNFFALGGHSLQATRIQARLRAVFGVALPLRSIFETPTLAALAEQITALQQGASGHEDAGPLVPQPRPTELPLALAQQRLWFLDHWEPDSPLYNIAGATRLEGDLRVAALVHSIQAVVQCHEALRTTIVTRDGQPQQVIHPALALALPLLDLSALALDTRTALMARLVVAEARRPFELARGPLVRATLLRVSEQAHVLLVSLHHIIADGWSLDLLMREIGALYAAALAGQPLALPDLPVQYADYALWQRDWLQGALLDRQIAYWTRQLQGAPDALVLPTDHLRPAVQTYQGASIACEVLRPLADALRQLSQRAGVTLFMTLLAAFQMLLAHAGGQDDIVVGTPIAGRTRPELERLIGFFANTLVLRTDLRGDPSLLEVLGRVREVCFGAYAHQDAPFERLVHELQPERSASHLPLFQVWFVLHEAGPAPVTLPGVTLLPFATESSIVRYDLRLDVHQQPEGLHIVFEYKTDLFEAATIARMARRFTTILELLTTQADIKLSTLARALADTDDQLRDTRQETITIASLRRLKNVRRELIRGAQPEEP